MILVLLRVREAALSCYGTESAQMADPMTPGNEFAKSDLGPWVLHLTSSDGRSAYCPIVLPAFPADKTWAH